MPLVLRIRIRLREQFGETHYRGQRIVQLMRHARHELADAGKLLALN